MNRIQKAATAAIALVITLAGSVLVTAPMALANPVPMASIAHAWHAGHHLAVPGWVKAKVS